MMNKSDFTRYLTLYKHYSDKKVKSIDLEMNATDLKEGTLHVTDIQLQEGSQPTGTVPATQDMLKLERFTIDEKHNKVGGMENIYQGSKPQVYENKRNRFFNVMGRGFETIVIPNVYLENYTVPMLTTGLDLTLWAKDDYDFLRVASFYGSYIDDDRTYTDESLSDNELNKRYTREFCFGKGKAGDTIKLFASKQICTKNDHTMPLGVQSFDVGQESNFNGANDVKYRNRQRFPMLPSGANRIVVQFMKMKNDGELKYMIDDGIGFHGIAEFTQWSWGGSKV